MTEASRPGAPAPDRAHHRRSTRAARLLVVVCLAVLAVLLPASAASAHATLLTSDPPDGAVLQVSPDIITFTFDETVTLTANSVQVFNARGNAVPAEVKGRDAVVSAAVPTTLPRGTYVVTWRVISADSHPVAGSITFSVGTPSATVVPPKAQVARDPALTRAISITAALNYLSLFLAGGLILFGLWVLNGVALREDVLNRLTILRWLGACIAVFTAANAIPLQGSDDLGLGLHGMGDPAALNLSLVADEVAVLSLQVVGLALALFVPRQRAVATIGVVLAVASPALVGHSRSNGPELLTLPADVLHLLAGAVWLGGLVGLALTLGPLRGRERDAATVISGFSTIGATVLAAVTITGAIAAWRIVGSWSALVHTGYGQLLLVKIAVVLLIAAVAGFNRWRLVPGVAGGVGHQARRTAALRVRTAVWCEATLLVVVLGVTGFLVNLSPNQQTTTSRAPVASRVGAALVGNTRVLATVAPGTVGRNMLTVQVQDVAGEPVDGYATPTVSLSSTKVNLGEVHLHPTASGTYTADVVLPQPGTWTVQVSLRLTRFDNPVTSVEVHVR